MVTRYSILTYIIGDYEVVHEVKDKRPDVEYVLVTDNKDLTSSTWNVVIVDNPYPQDPFWLCYQIRFNPFRYVHSDIVIRIDGSMGIANTDPLIDEFNKGNYDIALVPHPHRNNCADEYDTWVRTRKYSRTQANRVLNAIAEMGWDVRKDKGLYAYGFVVQRNNEVNNAINARTLQLLLDLAEEGKMVERVDQVIASVVINQFDLRPMMLRNNAVFGRIATLYSHKTNFVIGPSLNLFPAYYKKEPYPWAF